MVNKNAIKRLNLLINNKKTEISEIADMINFDVSAHYKIIEKLDLKQQLVQLEKLLIDTQNKFKIFMEKMNIIKKSIDIKDKKKEQKEKRLKKIAEKKEIINKKSFIFVKIEVPNGTDYNFTTRENYDIFNGDISNKNLVKNKNLIPIEKLEELIKFVISIVPKSKKVRVVIFTNVGPITFEKIYIDYSEFENYKSNDYENYLKKHYGFSDNFGFSVRPIN